MKRFQHVKIAGRNYRTSISSEKVLTDKQYINISANTLTSTLYTESKKDDDRNII